MTRPSPYMHYPSPIFRQQEDKPEPAARRLQTTCHGFPLNPYRIDYLQIHHPFSRMKSLWLLLPATSVIPGFLRFTAKRIVWRSLFPTGCQAGASRGSSPAEANRCRVVYSHHRSFAKIPGGHDPGCRLIGRSCRRFP